MIFPYRELMTALESSQDRIGKVFLELAPYLKFYSTYANDFQSAVKLVEYWTEKNKAFRTLISNQESRPEVKHKLNALLITPIQRIPRYVKYSYRVSQQVWNRFRNVCEQSEHRLQKSLYFAPKNCFFSLFWKLQEMIMDF